MKKYTKNVIFGLIIGTFAILALPTQNAFAGSQKDYIALTWGYHGGGHRIWDRYNSTYHHKPYHHTRKRSHVKPRKHHHDYDYYGFTYSLPFRAKRIKVNDTVYRYHDGVFYKKCKHGYDLIPAPIGALVRHLPPRAKRNYYRGTKYYHHDGTYYKKVRTGYRVIEKPHFEVSYYNNKHDNHYYSAKSRRDCY